MAPEGPERASQAPSLTSLPRVEDLPSAADGYDREKVREAFDAFRRHTHPAPGPAPRAPGCGQSGAEPTGHAVRMDALHMIRAAAEFADTIERDAQTRFGRAAAPHRGRGLAAPARAAGARGRGRPATARRASASAPRSLNAAQERGARDSREGGAARRPRSCARPRRAAARLLEQSRHQATELTNAARAEVEQTLEWARGAGRRDHQPRPGGRRAAARRRRPRRRGDRPASRSRSSAPRRQPPSRVVAPGLRPPSPARSCGSPSRPARSPRPRLRVSPRRSRRSRRRSPRARRRPSRRTKTTRPARLGPCSRAGSDFASRSRRSSSCCSPSVRGSPTCARASSCS